MTVVGNKQITRNQNEIQAKLQRELKKHNIDVLLLTKQESIYYATGFSSRFLGLMKKPGVAYAVVPAEGSIKLIVNDFERQAAEYQTTGVDIVKYNSWIFIEDDSQEASTLKKTAEMNLGQSFDIAVDAIKSFKEDPVLAVERSSLTWDDVERLSAIFGREHIVDGTLPFNKARSIKTKWEIEVLRRAAQIAEEAFYLTAKELQPGHTEVDVHAIYKKHAYALDKHVTEALMISSVGPNYSAAAIPRDYVLQAGDIVRLDGGVTYFGYQSDIARTFVVGGLATPKQEEKYQAILAGFKKGLSLIKPGVRFSEVFEVTQKTVQETGIPQYARGHVGHSISVDTFIEEYPLISPESDWVFEEGMVLCFECPYYSTTGGYNVEDTFVVTADGIDLFTNVNESLHWVSR
ncbi:M24 family metallopeptidase [Brevibacillus panacihumi]|uniref:Aminopeptidase P family protein n=1 Tax=Brevibacillus panacihumi TaxID=497735 RepID=A0A3M8CQH4_9BACL|nr:Xaa-Pro peptidase family protein [Brevibacillus panacihumi]RNB77903.1 aminopeptidase P family protein [Brevibacillus panacihumi]